MLRQLGANSSCNSPTMFSSSITTPFADQHTQKSSFLHELTQSAGIGMES